MFKDPDRGPWLVRAAGVRIHIEHCAFIRFDGELSGLFLFEIVKDRSEIDRENKPRMRRLHQNLRGVQCCRLVPTVILLTQARPAGSGELHI
jgi:hypothetical protein